MSASDDIHENYKKYRGKCKEMSEELVAANPRLTLVRGHYFCPSWNRNEPHWWCVDADGTIIDPTKKQFPSNGNGIYEPFNGIVECANCGTETTEEDARIDGRYAFCSYECNGEFIGVF